MPSPRARGVPPPRPSYPQRYWHSWTYTFDWPQPGKTKAITGLYPGQAEAIVTFYPKPDDIIWDPAATPADREKVSDSLALTVSLDVNVPEAGGYIVLKLQPDPARRISGVIFNGSREHPVVDHPVQLATVLQPPGPARRPPNPPTAERPAVIHSVVTEYLKTDERGEFVLLLDDSRTSVAGPGEGVLLLPWQTPDGRELPFVLLLDLAQSYQLTDAGTFYEIDLAKVGTLRLVFEGVEDLLQGGRTLSGPLGVDSINHSPTGMRIPALDPLARRFDLSKTSTVDWFMLEKSPGEYGMEMSFVTSRPKEDSPDLVAETTHSRGFRFKITGQEVTELAVPVGQLDKWQSSQPLWRRVEPPATQPQGAAE